VEGRRRGSAAVPVAETVDSRNPVPLAYDARPGPRRPSPIPDHGHRPSGRLSARSALPEIRPARALRFDRDAVGDLGAVVAPPYDVLTASDRARLRARHDRNVVRLDAPDVEVGDADDDRYRRDRKSVV